MAAVNNHDGQITTCATAGCGWRCCQFQQGNYIVLYPGEIDAARASGQSTAHLEITDADYHSGQKAICKAHDTASCDGGFKPLDCVSYPFFPAPPGDGGVELLIKGRKCPLLTQHLHHHAAMIRSAWNAVILRNPRIRSWLNKVRLVGYTEPPALKTPPSRRVGERHDRGEPIAHRACCNRSSGAKPASAPIAGQPSEQRALPPAVTRER